MVTPFYMRPLAEQGQLVAEATAAKAGKTRRSWLNSPQAVSTTPAPEPEPPPAYRCEPCHDLRRIAVETEPHRFRTIWCPHCAADKAAEQAERDTGITGDIKTWHLGNFRRKHGTHSEAGLKAAWEVVRRPVGFLTLHGGYGTGKSHPLAGICHECRKAGKEVHYTTLAGFLDYLKAAFDPKALMSYTARYDRMLAVEVLAIDEIEKVSMTEWADEKLYQLLDDRYRRAGQCLTVLASNNRLCDRDEAGQVTQTYHILPNSRYEAPIISRLLDGRFLVADMGDADARPSLDRGKWLKALEAQS